MYSREGNQGSAQLLKELEGKREKPPPKVKETGAEGSHIYYNHLQGIMASALQPSDLVWVPLTDKLGEGDFRIYILQFSSVMQRRP